jgi:hypothetical protein
VPHTEFTAAEVVEELVGRDTHEVVALCRGLMFLGSFRLAAMIRRVARDALLTESPKFSAGDITRYLAALVDAGLLKSARDTFQHYAPQLTPTGGLRSLALACGYGEPWLWNGWRAQPATRQIVSGSKVILAGPSRSIEDLVPASAMTSVLVTFKYCGVRLGESPPARIDISVVNRHAFHELAMRFGDGRRNYTMKPCRLLLYRNSTPPPAHLDTAVERLQARPDLFADKPTTGLLTVVELLLAGATAVTLAGFDLWTEASTAHAGYPYFFRGNSRTVNGGLDRASVAQSAGIHEPISQFTFLRSLLEVGRISVDAPLQSVLRMTEDEYAGRLEDLHGLPFVR